METTRFEHRLSDVYGENPDGAFPGGLYVGTTDGRMIHGTWVPDASFAPTVRGRYLDGLNRSDFRFGAPYLDAITHEIADDMETITAAVNRIARASETQSDSISQVSEGLGRISGVIQNNSSTSGQTASSSQELSVQARTLKGLAEKFRFKP